MKLQQLKYIWEVANHNLNVSVTAEKLFTSQPGVSKQIRMLEDELNVQIFRRNGKHLAEVTPAGRVIIDMAGKILDMVEGVERIAEDINDESRGSLIVATTHMQARYVLPDIIFKFIKLYPDVSLQMQQGNPLHINEMVSKGLVDFAIASEPSSLFDNLITMPCYRWNRSIIVCPDHPLANEKNLTLENLAKYPLVTYVIGFTGRSQLDQAFKKANLIPKLVFTASDADVIKTYVRMNLGVGIIANMAYDAKTDADLLKIDASHLFEPSVARISIRRGAYLRNYMFEFIKLFAPHLTKEIVQQSMLANTKSELKDIFKNIELPEIGNSPINMIPRIENDGCHF